MHNISKKATELKVFELPNVERQPESGATEDFGYGYPIVFIRLTNDEMFGRIH